MNGTRIAPLSTSPTSRISDGDHVHSLHNSGPSPVSVYRTAAVGTVHTLDLFHELHSATALPFTLRRAFRPVAAEFSEDLPMPDVIAAAASAPRDVLRLTKFLLDHLPPESGVAASAHTPMARATRGAVLEETALHALTELSERLAALGWLSPMPALVWWANRHTISGSPFSPTGSGLPVPWLPSKRGERGELLRLAWLVVATSHAAPPLILFTRSPSLRFWRPDGALTMRWLGDMGRQP